MTAQKPLTESGAVLGANVSTAPTTNKTTVAGILGAALSAGLVVFGQAAHNPTVVKDVATIVGGAGGLGSIASTVWAYIRAAEAEVTHAIAGVEKGIVAVDPALTPEALNAKIADLGNSALNLNSQLPVSISAEVRKQLAVLFPTTPPAA